MSSTPTDSRRFSIRLPRPLWIGLAAGLLAIAAAALQIGGPIYRRHLVVREIKQDGGHVTLIPGGPDWLRKLVGDEWMRGFDSAEQAFLSPERARRKGRKGAASEAYPLSGRVGRKLLPRLEELTRLRDVSLFKMETTDADMRHLVGLTQLETIDITGRGNVLGDASLQYLQRSTKMKQIQLSAPEVTGTGLMYLRDMSDLDAFYLYESSVTDASLVHLSGLRNLKTLALLGSQVTAAGMKHLSGLPRLEVLSLTDTQVSEVDVGEFASLSRVRFLDLGGTHITDVALPELLKMPRLGTLIVSRTQVTDVGIAAVKRARPKFDIRK